MTINRRIVSGVSCTVAAAALCAVVSSGAMADEIYNSGGFESPTFSPGNLVGQDGWLTTGGASTADVSDSIPTAGGTQAVELFRGGADGLTATGNFAVDVSSAPAHDRYVFVDMDMQVNYSGDQDADPVNVSYGPGFGLDIYSTGVKRIFSFTVDSADGLFTQYLSNNGVSTYYTDATLDNYHNYQVILDFVDQVTFLVVDGDVVSTTAFINPVNYGAGDRMTDADLFAAATTGDYPNVEGTAYVDNFVISDSSVIPEPGSLALMALGGMAMIRRRRK